MTHNETVCPNCRQKSVTEYPACFACGDCGYWGYSRDKIIFTHEQFDDFRPSGQVCRKPRAA